MYQVRGGKRHAGCGTEEKGGGRKRLRRMKSGKAVVLTTHLWRCERV